MSFAEIVKGRDASVRMTDDGYLYAVDLVMVMTGADRNYAGQVIQEKTIMEWESPNNEKNIVEKSQ